MRCVRCMCAIRWLRRYHIYERNRQGVCPVCGEETPNLAVHVHEVHNPQGPHMEVSVGAGVCMCGALGCGEGDGLTVLAELLDLQTWCLPAIIPPAPLPPNLSVVEFPTATKPAVLCRMHPYLWLVGVSGAMMAAGAHRERQCCGSAPA